MQVAVSFIGFGEAGRTFAGTGPASAFDIDPARSTSSTLAQALSGATLVLCVVTADQALAAATAAAAVIEPGAIYCDMNSVAPETKFEAARLINASGAHYVDVAIMAPVHPRGRSTPLVIAGPEAGTAQAMLAAAGFTDVRIAGSAVGRASAIKMIRSVMVKGIEALTDEMMAAAQAADVVDDVLASLDASEQALPWPQRAAYNLERMTTHGERRAAEMEESARTLRALGVRPVMTEGTIIRQRAAAQGVRP